ncbi:MAG TPA: RDD family protein [Thermoleophilia bacterium]|nr:RDD family protein [Thermoleophilia bacterium]
MQQITTQEHVEYASLGWRFAAVLVDTVVFVGLLIIAVMVYVLVLVAQGKIDPNDPTAAQTLTTQLQVPNWVANVIVFGGLFVYYYVLEAMFSASVGKLVFRMRVTMPDGSRPGGAAVLVRNIVRIPEAWLLYVPAGISCLASARRQRLGDHAARTVVVRRRTAAGAATFGPASRTGPPGYAPPAPVTPAASAPTRPAAPVAPPAPAAPVLGDALTRLKTAALAARGAHLNYLHFSERELASGAEQRGDAYSEGYVTAWFTLVGAVAELVTARDAAATAATAAGETLDDAFVAQPDLAHLLRELGPYFPARSDEEIHEAFLIVARSEATPSS